MLNAVYFLWGRGGQGQIESCLKQMQSWKLVCFEGLAFGKALAIQNVALAGAVNTAAGAGRSKDVGLVDFCHSGSVAPHHIAEPFRLMGFAPPCHISESTAVDLHAASNRALNLLALQRGYVELPRPSLAYQLVELGG